MLCTRPSSKKRRCSRRRPRPEQLRARGKTAASEGNRDGAEQAIASLTGLRDQLRQEYQLRIVNREGQKTGFWTFPEINTAATNYYVVVEAIGAEGKPLTLPITNEENGQTENVAIWGGARAGEHLPLSGERQEGRRHRGA